MFVLFDNEGRMLRRSMISVPIGLLAVSPDGRLAVGMRGEPDREFVLYKIERAA